MTRYFDEAYRDYGLQNPTRKLNHYLDVIDAGVGPGPKTLLDIGSGLGAFLERAAERHPDWSFAAMDIDLEAVAETQRRVPQATILGGSADEALFAGESFDVITAWDVFEHVPDLEAAAKSVTHMLKPGGLLVFVVPVYDGITGPLIRRLDKDPTHVHKRSRDEWLKWAEAHFKSIEWHGILRYLVGRTYVHAPTRRFRAHTPAILVSALRG
jgi:2-polyprenyl-3-methyl-5-hydroxy-6-metoxy-1,4-benzoquinol methylase